MSNKAMVAGAAALLALYIGSDHALSQTRVRYDNGWQFGGGQLYAPLAQDLGCFTREKLDVTMDRGYGSTDTVTKIASGAYDIGEADFNTLAQFKGAHPQSKAIAIFIIDDASPASVLTLKTSGIRKPKDLVGKRIGDSIGEASRVLFPAFAKANNIDPNSVTWVSSSGDLREQLLVQKRADAIAGHVFTVMNGLLALGVKHEETQAFRYSDWGVHIFGASLVANTDWLQSHGDAAKAFVACIADALKAQLVHQKMAIAAAQKHNTVLDEAIELANLRFENSLVFTDNVRKNGLSSVAPERITNALAQVADSVGLPPPPVDRVLTRKYLPPASVLKVE